MLFRVLGVTFNGLGRSAGNPTGDFFTLGYLSRSPFVFIPAQINGIKPRHREIIESKAVSPGEGKNLVAYVVARFPYTTDIRIIQTNACITRRTIGNKT